MSVQPYKKLTVWRQSYSCTPNTLPFQLYTVSSEAMTALTKPDSSPTVVKKMNLPVAAKLVNF